MPFERILPLLHPDRSVFPIELLIQVGNVKVLRHRDPVDHGVRRKTYPYVLRGLLRCAYCDALAERESDSTLRSTLGGEHAQLGRGRYRHRPDDQCSSKNRSVKMDIADAEVFRLIKHLVFNAEEFEKMIDISKIVIIDATDSELFEEQKALAITKCERTIRVARLDAKDGVLSFDNYVKIKEDNEREIELWKSRVSNIEEIRVELTNRFQKFAEITKLLETAEAETKQQFVRSVFDEIVFDLEKERIVRFKLKPWTDRYLRHSEGAFIKSVEFKHRVAKQSCNL